MGSQYQPTPPPPPKVEINTSKASAAGAKWKVAYNVVGGIAMCEFVVQLAGRVLEKFEINQDLADKLKKFNTVDIVFGCNSSGKMDKA